MLMNSKIWIIYVNKKLPAAAAAALLYCWYAIYIPCIPAPQQTLQTDISWMQPLYDDVDISDEFVSCQLLATGRIVSQCCTNAMKGSCKVFPWMVLSGGLIRFEWREQQQKTQAESIHLSWVGEYHHFFWHSGKLSHVISFDALLESTSKLLGVKVRFLSQKLGYC